VTFDDLIHRSRQPPAPGDYYPDPDLIWHWVQETAWVSCKPYKDARPTGSHQTTPEPLSWP